MYIVYLWHFLGPYFGSFAGPLDCRGVEQEKVVKVQTPLSMDGKKYRVDVEIPHGSCMANLLRGCKGRSAHDD